MQQIANLPPTAARPPLTRRTAERVVEPGSAPQQAPDGPATAPATAIAPRISGAQLSTATLVVLLNAQVDRPPGVTRLANLAAGEAPIQLPPNWNTRTPDAVPLGWTGGSLPPGALAGQHADEVAKAIVGAVGHHGRLSLDDLDVALDLDKATCSAEQLASIRSGIHADWRYMVGNVDHVDASRLADAIRKYQASGAV